MDNYNNGFDELEQMKQQISMLKERVEEKSKLNEKLLNDSLKDKMSKLSHFVRNIIIFGFLGILLWIFIGTAFPLSWYFVTFTILMMGGSMAADYYVNKVDINDFTTNLTTTAQRLIRMKRIRWRQVIIGFVLIAIWFPWMMWEFSSSMPEKEVKGFAISAGIGLLIGACIGIRLVIKMQRANDEMLKQIEEMQKLDKDE